ncbi:uncharacterized protein LDX57_010439 [Aspergillus melleus]|uniref:uncharacterized protein n=1 Tax=Aspergillus melleus TaxID=138277 RepID=UPI001E8DB31C|nr:uncharacterized protein LDX57_010439 [Aspergillus melleus]KAH8432810.1 hypothetical protein LDX57_010439 [Aspergillus melleus]
MSPEELLEMPAGSPPPGQQSNLKDPPNLETAGRAVLLFFWISASTLFLLRMYTKLFVIRKVKLSDYSIILAWGIFMGYFAPAWLLSKVGPGVDQWNISLKNFISLLFYFHVASIMYGCCIFFIKLAILLQILEVFVPLKSNNYFFWSCHALIWINFVFYTISFFLEIFSCRPMDKVWNILITEGTCLDTTKLNIAASSINAASDVVILVLPQLRIWGLHMPLHKKIAVSAVFFVGIFACVSSVVRLAYTVHLYQTDNKSYYSYLAGVWTLPELASGIIVACLPVIPRFVRSVDPNNRLSRLGASVQELLSTVTGGSRQRSRESSRNTAKGQGDGTVVMPTGKGSESDQYPLVAMSSQASSRKDAIATKGVT